VNESLPAFWRVHCHIGHHPGQWQRWYREQCCAIGWPPAEWGGTLNPGGYTVADTSGDTDFATSVSNCRRMKPGDWIVATLTGNRVGRLGRVFRVAIEDDVWNPVVSGNRVRFISSRTQEPDLALSPQRQQADAPSSRPCVSSMIAVRSHRLCANSGKVSAIGASSGRM
jgi:hypothetical protein